MRTVKMYLFILLIYPFLFSCKKASQDLPPLTHSGKNIVAVKVNGKVYTANGKMIPFSPVTEGGVYFGLTADSSITIGAAQTSPVWSFYVTFPYSKTSAIFPIGSTPFWASWSSGSNNDYQIYTDATHTGTVTVDYYDGKILSGTFEYDGLISDGSGVDHVEGNFDIGQ